MIHLTPTAVQHIRACLNERGHGIGIRLGLRVAGCSGLAYVLEFADQSMPDDLVFNQDGVSILVAPKDLPNLNGVVMDYVTEGLNSGFKFTNPNQKGECGCGESFTV